MPSRYILSGGTYTPQCPKCGTHRTIIELSPDVIKSRKERAQEDWLSDPKISHYLGNIGMGEVLLIIPFLSLQLFRYITGDLHWHLAIPESLLPGLLNIIEFIQFFLLMIAIIGGMVAGILWITGFFRGVQLADKKHIDFDNKRIAVQMIEQTRCKSCKAFYYELEGFEDLGYYPVEHLCNRCHGSTIEEITQICSNCHGLGIIAGRTGSGEIGGATCTACGGRREIIIGTQKCMLCHGIGRVTEQKMRQKSVFAAIYREQNNHIRLSSAEILQRQNEKRKQFIMVIHWITAILFGTACGFAVLLYHKYHIAIRVQSKGDGRDLEYFLKMLPFGFFSSMFYAAIVRTTSSGVIAGFCATWAAYTIEFIYEGGTVVTSIFVGLFVAFFIGILLGIGGSLLGLLLTFWRSEPDD